MLERHKVMAAIAAPKWRAPVWIIVTVVTQVFVFGVFAKVSGNWGPIPLLLLVGLPVVVWQQLNVAKDISLLNSVIFGTLASVAVLMAWAFSLFLLTSSHD